MNLHYTYYSVIKKVSKGLKFKVRTDDINLIPPTHGTAEYNMMQERVSMMGGQNPTSDFDVCWVDGNVPPEALAKLKQY